MGTTASIVLLLVLGGAFLFLRKQNGSASKPGSSESRADPAPEDSQFHAVSLKFRGTACEAARQLQDQRFLSGSAPRLPLAECDVAECDCRFTHHDDRRSGNDRRDPYASGIGGLAASQIKEEKRAKDDRRADPPDSL